YFGSASCLEVHGSALSHQIALYQMWPVSSLVLVALPSGPFGQPPSQFVGNGCVKSALSAMVVNPTVCAAIGGVGPDATGIICTDKLTLGSAPNAKHGSKGTAKAMHFPIIADSLTNND